MIIVRTINIERSGLTPIEDTKDVVITVIAVSILGLVAAIASLGYSGVERGYGDIDGATLYTTAQQVANIPTGPASNLERVSVELTLLNKYDTIKKADEKQTIVLEHSSLEGGQKKVSLPPFGPKGEYGYTVSQFSGRNVCVKQNFITHVIKIGEAPC